MRARIKPLELSVPYSRPLPAAPAQAVGQVKLGVVILTMGDRPVELTALLDSVLAQHGPPMRIVVVGSGTSLPRLPDGVEGVELPGNRGIPGGRNAALAHLRATGAGVDVVMYLDDDGPATGPGRRGRGASGVRR